jgi:hypothetical protein
MTRLRKGGQHDAQLLQKERCERRQANKCQNNVNYLMRVAHHNVSELSTEGSAE